MNPEIEKIQNRADKVKQSAMNLNAEINQAKKQKNELDEYFMKNFQTTDIETLEKMLQETFDNNEKNKKIANDEINELERQVADREAKIREAKKSS
jgi:DNA repair exonuclease SbcCD ATPase subunit